MGWWTYLSWHRYCKIYVKVEIRNQDTYQLKEREMIFVQLFYDNSLFHIHIIFYSLSSFFSLPCFWQIEREEKEVVKNGCSNITTQKKRWKSNILVMTWINGRPILFVALIVFNFGLNMVLVPINMSTFCFNPLKNFINF